MVALFSNTLKPPRKKVALPYVPPPSQAAIAHTNLTAKLSKSMSTAKAVSDKLSAMSVDSRPVALRRQYMDPDLAIDILFAPNSNSSRQNKAKQARAEALHGGALSFEPVFFGAEGDGSSNNLPSPGTNPSPGPKGVPQDGPDSGFRDGFRDGSGDSSSRKVSPSSKLSPSSELSPSSKLSASSKHSQFVSAPSLRELRHRFDATKEHSHISQLYSRLYDEKLNPFTPSEELSVSAMHAVEESMQAVGFTKVREAFPEAELARQSFKRTGHFEDSLERYRELFPASRYGASRTKKVFEDPTTFFRDLDPLVALKIREEYSIVEKEEALKLKDEQALQALALRNAELEASGRRPSVMAEAASAVAAAAVAANAGGTGGRGSFGSSTGRGSFGSSTGGGSRSSSLMAKGGGSRSSSLMAKKVHAGGSHGNRSTSVDIFVADAAVSSRIERETHELLEKPVLKRAPSPLRGGFVKKESGYYDDLEPPSEATIVLKRSDRQVEFDEQEMLGSEAGYFPSKTEVFSQRVNSIMEAEDGSVGKREYLRACAALSIAPNVYFLDNITRSHIDLQFANLSRLDVAALAVPLRFNAFVVHLDLTDNKIGDEAGERLVRALGENPSLTNLFLKGNDLQQRAGRAIAEWLGGERALSGGGGGGEGVKLQRLDLSFNGLNDHSVVPLGEALKEKNRSVRELFLNKVRAKKWAKVAKAANRVSLRFNGGERE